MNLLDSGPPIRLESHPEDFTPFPDNDHLSPIPEISSRTHLGYPASDDTVWVIRSRSPSTQDA